MTFPVLPPNVHLMLSCATGVAALGMAVNARYRGGSDGRSALKRSATAPVAEAFKAFVPTGGRSALKRSATAPVAEAFKAFVPTGGRSALKRSATLDGNYDWWWLAAIALLLTVGRWPTLGFPYALNPDESQLLAGAQTLRWDPVFWRSVNGMTSGPLNFYALWPLGTLLGGDSYLTARVTALVLLIGALGAAHLTVSHRFGARAARLGGLPTVLFLAFTAHPDFTHYSSELLSMALIAVAIAWAAACVWERQSSPWRDLATGVLLGAVPFAKPQAAPIALAVGAGLVAWRQWGPSRSHRAIARLVAGAALPVCAAALLILSHGLGGFFVTAYLKANGNYVDTAGLTVLQAARSLLTQIEPTSPIFYGWVAASAATGLLALGWVKPVSRPDRDFLIASFLLLAVAFACVVAPRRNFSHYLMLLPVPWTLFCGALLGADFRRDSLVHARPGSGSLPGFRRTNLDWLVAALSGILLAVRAGTPYEPPNGFTPFHSDFSGQVTALIRAYSTPGDALSVWGWRPEYYVLSGLRQATRDAITESSILPNPYQDFFRSCYLQDLKSHRPAVFVDGVGPGGFGYDRRATQSPKAVFPALADWIERHYTLEADVDGARVYVRNDRLARLTPARHPSVELHPLPALSQVLNSPTRFARPVR
jgi:hypothetical protein